jgi:hypothetical protein
MTFEPFGVIKYARGVRSCALANKQRSNPENAILRSRETSAGSLRSKVGIYGW